MFISLFVYTIIHSLKTQRAITSMIYLPDFDIRFGKEYTHKITSEGQHGYKSVLLNQIKWYVLWCLPPLFICFFYFKSAACVCAQYYVLYRRFKTTLSFTCLLYIPAIRIFYFRCCVKINAIYRLSEHIFFYKRTHVFFLLF